MIFLALIALVYGLLISFLLFGYLKVPETSKKGSTFSTTFSIVIPFRNEAGNLPFLLDSLDRIEYPSELYEVILVNDASEDASAELCRKFSQVRPDRDVHIIDVVRKSASPKKDAVSTAIEKAKHDYILTSDADCEVPENWLKEFDSYIGRTEAKMIAGPVMTKATVKGERETLLRSFQELDFLSLQAATIGGFGLEKPFMCNGANLCYVKEGFLQVNGYAGNEGIASGDDIFLLEKFLDEGIKVGYLKSNLATVETLPLSTWTGLISQRIRWASKTAAYKRMFGKGVGVIVLLMNVALAAGTFTVIAGSLPVKVFFIFFLVKMNIDFVLVYRSSQFFRREKIMKKFIGNSLLYPYVSSYVALASLLPGYQWKGRRMKK